MHAGDYIYVGEGVAIERALIDRFTGEFIHHDSSIHALVFALNQEAINTEQYQLSQVDAHILSHILYCYLYILLDLSMGSLKVDTPVRLDEYDNWAWEQFPRLLSSFSHLWMNHETIIGRCNDQCSKCLVVDGNQKIRRRLCGYKDVRVHTNEMEGIVIGCCRTPVSGSRFCVCHQESANVNSDGVLAKKSPCEDRSRRPRTRGQLLARKDANKLSATSCRTTKEKSNEYVKKCTRSFGFIALVFNCRIITSFSELFRSETLREIINLLVATIDGRNSSGLLVVKLIQSVCHNSVGQTCTDCRLR